MDGQDGQDGKGGRPMPLKGASPRIPPSCYTLEREVEELRTKLREMEARMKVLHEQGERLMARLERLTP